MIKVNMQLGKNFNGEVNAENFPRLFNPLNPKEKISNCSIMWIDDDIDVQTTYSDSRKISCLVSAFIETERTKANAEITKAKKRLELLQVVSPNKEKSNLAKKSEI